MGLLVLEEESICLTQSKLSMIKPARKTVPQRKPQPVIHQGWIYVCTERGKLVAINTGDPTLTGWAQWGGNAARTGVR